MNLTITNPSGPRQAAMPRGGIRTESDLLDSIVMTLALEASLGTDRLHLLVNLHGLDPLALQLAHQPQ